MIIARAPLRISFLGGGTDYAEYFENQGFGSVFGTAIDRFVYVMLDSQPGFEKSKFKLMYRNIEEVEDISEIKHPAVRTILKECNIREPLNLATMANLPGRSGLGSSSAFTVAMLSAVYRYLGRTVDNVEIAHRSVEIERHRLQEAGGFQDQYHSAIGGCRTYQFQSDEVSFSDDLLDLKKREFFELGTALIATNATRDSAVFAARNSQNMRTRSSLKELDSLRDICIEATKQIEASDEVAAFEVLKDAVKESWAIKESQLGEVSSEVSEIIQKALARGAEAVKLCGAGGAGFVLVLANPERISSIIEAFPKTHVVKPKYYEKGVTTFEF